MRRLTRAIKAALSLALVCSAQTLADVVTLTNGQSVDGGIEGLSDSRLLVRVNGQLIAFPASPKQGIVVSKVRSISFDGIDDYFVVTLKSGESLEGIAGGFSKGGLIIGTNDPIRLTAIKELTRSKPPGEKAVAELTMLDLAIGQKGRFRHPLLVGFIFDKGFVGQLNYRSAETGNHESKLVVVRGVDTNGMTSGSWARLNQEFKVDRTERLTNGDTVLVAEPIDPTNTNVSSAEPMRGTDSYWRRVQPVAP